ncbi:DUF4340 domain-containing protein [Luteolibacter yonseiensis]|uniref:DUF4340 domain-containing protein n=1 Tax=Luteolibacter yonseiensis TaxID=1144680 RepID=A0A934VCS3_9BACT|nr:DUF4340 domain-containing protein [Luteolibacter yonseiensis]MBK1816789.1 DUF4340 domain-containing protein [Luteolibacter yonseiensis]
MRSFGFTLILALLALLVCGVAGWQWKEGNFNSVFGAPPTLPGYRIYASYNAPEKRFVPDFTAPDVKHIQVSRDGVTGTFEFTDKGWQCTLPWKDRMDPRAAVDIINFTLSMRVEDFAKRDELDAQKAGLKDGAVNIRLEGADHKLLALYKLGRPTPWLATFPDLEKNVPTVFIQRRDSDHKGYIYSCTGDIGDWFKDGLKNLRDHQPFYFNPLGLRQIRTREFTLACDAPGKAWRIIQPQNLVTDPKAMKALLEGLYQMRATRISDRASVTLPSNGTQAKTGLIAITPFGSDVETVLEIYPPESPEAREVKATVSDRPDTIFDLPLKPEEKVVSLADLPLTINGLRDSALMNLNIKALSGLVIQPANGPEILITRTPPQPWTATINGASQEANQERLFGLMQSLSEGRAIAFKTDAATDFAPWGLDKPLLKIRLVAVDNHSFELAFGTDGKGNYYANRIGTPTVMQVDGGLVSSFPVRDYEWRHGRLWSIDRLNLLAIVRQSGTTPPLKLLYDFNTEEWTANSNGEDLTPRLVATRTNFLLGVLEGLKVNRWLSPEDESANRALRSPSLVFKILENTTDDMGDVNGRITHDLILAPGSTSPNPAFYYGRVATHENPFLLDRDTYLKLATELLEK